MRVVPVLLALAADLAWGLVGSFWGFTVLAVLVLWVALNQPHATATGPKAYNTEQRLNAAMARIPNPQTSTGTYGNTSYSITNTLTYQSGVPTAGAAHFHYPGSGITDAFNALYTSHTDLCTAHNAVVTALQNANVFH
jgi:hypothetical protein